MTEPRSFLFASWEGGGNVPPMLTLVRRLIARGHRVRVLGEACTRGEAEAAGAEFRPWATAPSRADTDPANDPMRDWEAPDPAEVIRRIVDRLMCGNALPYARDTLAELERERADAIVTSEMLLGPMLAGEAAGVPAAALACNIPILPLPGLPPFGPGLLPARDEAERAMHAGVRAMLDALLAEGLAPLNAARAALGLAPRGSVWEQYAALDRNLCATAAAFDFPADSLPANFRYVGPLLDEPGWAAGAIPDGLDASRPLVLVGLSTTYQAQEEMLGRCVEALAGLPVQAVVTTGPAVAPEALPPAPNVIAVRHASHDALLVRAAAALTHAGHGTVMRALRAEVPLLCMPMGRDQNDNAARVAARGAGLTLRPAAAADEIRGALTRLLDEPAFREGARRLGRAVAAEADPDRAAAELEEIASPRPACAAA